MARAGALLLILAAMVAVQGAGPPMAASTVMLPLGFSLIAAYLLGGVAGALGLPRLSGYLVFGLLCGPYVLNLITASMARDLQIVNGLALALIALVAGLELNLARLRPQMRSVLLVGGIVLFGTLTLLTLLLWAVWPWLPFEEVGDARARLAAAFVLATLVASFSPTVTIAVIAECRAQGPFSQFVMAVVVIADLLLILVFAVAVQFARWTMSSPPGGIGLGVQLSWEIFGSLAFGGMVGSVFAAYLRLVAREVTLALLGLCAVLALVAPLLHFELILTALAAGLVVENVAPPEGDELRVAIERGALPVLIVFFAAAGASLQLDALAALGGTAVAVALVRLAAIRGMTALAVRSVGLTTPVPLVWMGLISQAGVTLGLAAIVALEFPGWGAQAQTLIVALTGLHVLIGPILFRAALHRAGEIEQA